MNKLLMPLGLALLLCYACTETTPKKETVEPTPADATPPTVMASDIKLLRLYFPVTALGPSNKAVLAIPTLRNDSLMAGVYGFAFGGSGSSRNLSFALKADCKADSLIKPSLPDTLLLSPLLITKAFVQEIRKPANGYQTVLLEPAVSAGAIVWTIYATKSAMPLKELEILSARVKIGVANPCPPGNMVE